MRAPWTRLALGLLGVLGLSLLTGRVTGYRTLPFAVVVQVLLMRWALALLRLTRPALRGEWFRVRAWEAPLYRAAGALRYRALLRRVGWERFRRDAQGFDGTRASLPAYERATREAEYSHLILGAMTAALVLFAALRRAAGTAGWLTLTGVVFHLYPVLLQRTLRARLQRLPAGRLAAPARPRELVRH